MRFVRFVSLTTVLVLIILTFSATSFGTDQALTELQRPAAQAQEAWSQEPDLIQEVTDSESTDESDPSQGTKQADQTGSSGGETQEPSMIKIETKVSGLILKTTKKARSKFTDTIKISPAHGRTMRLQMKSGSKWVTKKTYKLANAKEALLKITYPNDWWKKTKSSWRLVIEETEDQQA